MGEGNGRCEDVEEQRGAGAHFGELLAAESIGFDGLQ